MNHIANVQDVTDTQWEFFETNGFLTLGRVLDDADLQALQTRIDDIMLHRADIDDSQLIMQLDGSAEQTLGSKGATLTYRKIQNLERDDLFRAYLSRPLFGRVCQRVYGDVPVATYRAMFMNKPAHEGTFLQWHQDRWTHLDRDPLLTVWTALDPATIANGCVQVIPGSHRDGLINPSAPSGFLTDEQAAEHCGRDRVHYLELAPGEAVLMHNWLVHASDVNHTAQSRRAFSVCYLDGRTHDRSGSSTFTPAFPAAQ